MAQVKEQNKTPEKELNKMEITNLSDAESKTLVIRMLKELTEYGNNIKEEIKVTLTEINKILQGINSEGKGPWFKSTTWNIRKKETFNQNRKKEHNFFKKYEDSIRRFWDISKYANIQTIRMPEGEEQEIENLKK